MFYSCSTGSNHFINKTQFSFQTLSVLSHTPSIFSEDYTANFLKRFVFVCNSLFVICLIRQIVFHLRSLKKYIWFKNSVRFGSKILKTKWRKKYTNSNKTLPGNLIGFTHKTTKINKVVFHNFSIFLFLFSFWKWKPRWKPHSTRMNMKMLNNTSSAWKDFFLLVCLLTGNKKL